jgi:hypothetical protein
MEGQVLETGYFFERLDDEPTKPPILERRQVLYKSFPELITAILAVFEDGAMEDILEQRDEENDGDPCESDSEAYRELAALLKTEILSTGSGFGDTTTLCAWLSESDTFEEFGCNCWVNVGFATRFGEPSKRQKNT